MSDWVAAAALRPLGFEITVVPGTGTVQGASVVFEVVLPSGRVAGPYTKDLDITQIQTTIDAVSSTIITQLLTDEQLAQIWSAP